MSRVLDTFRDALAVPVHGRFELQARATPDAIAVRFKDESLTYAELNGRANQLAHYLRGQGIDAEDRVVVAVEPGFEIVVALLAILKAGATYVPLDPSYPAGRIQTIVEDIQPKLLVTHSRVTPDLPTKGVTTLELDRAQSSLQQLSTDNHEISSAPDQTAYVFYTSGTTGAPKGVMASQQNLASYIGLAQERYGFNRADVAPALARFSFSISLFELLSPLAAGGTLLVLERAHVLDFARLSQTLQGVTFFHAGPSLLRGLLGYLEQHYQDLSVFDGVRHASSGGDLVPVEVLEGLRDTFRRAEVFVIYGCSEISCMGCTYPVPRDVPLLKTYVGKAFQGVTARVVDEQLREVPRDEVGEVLFAGPGVVKGYLNRPELVAEKFVQLDGERFYKTGDRGRVGADGWLELLGRSDFQIKLGGIRIEPGEIEHHLRKAPGVENGVVVARELAAGQKALVAYVVVRADEKTSSAQRAAALRGYLSQQLPDYMLPSFYVELAALPLNHNLKIDRKALPELPPAATPIARSQPLPEPESDTERHLAALWQRALRGAPVGPQDTFFDLGGTSMLALQLMADVERELGVTLNGLELLREPLGVLAALCEQRAGKSQRARAVAPPPPEPFEVFHFGPDNSLYGVLHGPHAAARCAVLVCAPLGQEALRAHFVLQRAARRLGAAGIPVLRFDYYGFQDSLGETKDGSCSRWEADIVAAYEELARRTHATRVVAIGARLGATLLCAAAPRLKLSKVVMWDPVERGADYVAQLERAHQEQLRARPSIGARWRLLLARGTGRGRRELLGSCYSEQTLGELRSLQLPAPTSTSAAVARLHTQSDWLESSHLEDMLPDVGISQRLVEMVGEP